MRCLLRLRAVAVPRCPPQPGRQPPGHHGGGDFSVLATRGTGNATWPLLAEDADDRTASRTSSAASDLPVFVGAPPIGLVDTPIKKTRCFVCPRHPPAGPLTNTRCAQPCS